MAGTLRRALKSIKPIKPTEPYPVLNFGLTIMALSNMVHGGISNTPDKFNKADYSLVNCIPSLSFNERIKGGRVGRRDNILSTYGLAT